MSNRCTHPGFLQAASMAAFPWRRLGGWGDPREGFILTMCRKWHATCGTGSDELHSEKAFFWFEQLTPVWPGLRHAVRPWSSGESRLEVRMSQRHLAKRDQSQSVHQSCGKLRLCGLDRPDTEAGGAVLQMVSAAAWSAGHDKALVVEETSSLAVGQRCLVVLHGCRMT